MTKLIEFSILANMVALLVILGLLIIAVLYYLKIYLLDKRRDRIQQKLDKIFERSED